MALINKLTAIADEVRELSGTSETLTLDDMASSIGEVNSEIGTQSDLLDQVVVALEDKASGGSGEWIGDGNTHIWISLHEGRTSPMLGVCPKGTVTVDWGDGTEPDVLTGTSTSTVKWTPTHEYAKAGDYIITLTVDGAISFLGNSNVYSQLLLHTSSVDTKNSVYQNAIKKVEIGSGVTSIGSYAFYACYSITNVNIPDGVTSIGDYAFSNIYSLAGIVIPNSVTSISRYAFHSCKSIVNITIPDGVTSIGDYAFNACTNLVSVAIPGSVRNISNYTFQYCGGVVFYDFTSHVEVPSLSAKNAFSGMPDDCEIRVPAALYDEWIAATNWSTYANQIVAV